MKEKIVGKNAEQWREYAFQALAVRRKAIEEDQEMMRM